MHTHIYREGYTHRGTHMYREEYTRKTGVHTRRDRYTHIADRCTHAPSPSGTLAGEAVEGTRPECPR